MLFTFKNFIKKLELLSKTYSIKNCLEIFKSQKNYKITNTVCYF